MNDITTFALLGLGTGAIFAMIAQGLVLVYKGSGVLNFAQGAFVMFGAYAYYEFTVRLRLPFAPALGLTILVTALLGAAVHLLVLRPMRHSSPTARVVATLAVMVVLQSAAILRYGLDPRAVPSGLPTRTVSILPHTPVGLDRFIIFFIGLLLTAVLWIVYRRTSFGRMTSAVAENQMAAASLGHSPDLVATINWTAGAASAGLAGALIAPITYVDPNSLVLLVLPAIAAALVGGFSSFPIAFGAAIVLGVGESLTERFVQSPGWSDSLPFLIVIVILVVRGTSLPMRSFVLDRLPAVGTGRIRKIPVATAFVALGAILLFGLSLSWQTAFTVTIVMAILCLSVVVITGLAGQLSLAQYVLAGIGALAAAKFSQSWHMEFPLALLLAVLVTIVVGALVAIPSLRTRGLSLAVATLGLATVGYELVLNSSRYNGGVDGIEVKSPSLFGWSIDPYLHAGRYAFVALCALVGLSITVANLRRGAVGRRLVAMRSNERACAALGISVYRIKIYAFMVAGAIAAVGGVLFAFLQPAVIVTQFDVLSSINLVTVTVVGGVGMIGGAIVGATLIPGGIATELLHNFLNLDPWLPLIGGINLIIVLRAAPNGIYVLNRDLARKLTQKLARRLRKSAPKPASTARERPRANAPVRKVPPGSLRIDGLRVQFGGVVALSDVSLEVHPGEIHGLIGPNGAGKTTLIDAVTGFVRSTAGKIRLNDTDLARWSAHRRARAGVARSFQSLELFDDLSVEENLAIACDSVPASRYLSDLIWPRSITLSGAALAAVEHFGLADDLGTKPVELPYGRRRLIAIARAVASQPSVLLLDEPAAGLSDREATELSQMIQTLAHDWGIAVLLVEHNIDMVISVSDRVTVLDSGSVLVSRDPAEVRTDPAVLAAYLGIEDASEDAADLARVDTMVKSGPQATVATSHLPEGRRQ
jgi:ABC-type branched-subunit amino acid transport system ATPase component/branched-subunit amino acid ABC-type transport system permease component